VRAVVVVVEPVVVALLTGFFLFLPDLVAFFLAFFLVVDEVGVEFLAFFFFAIVVEWCGVIKKKRDRLFVRTTPTNSQANKSASSICCFLWEKISDLSAKIVL
jgi:hypothetical protein